MLGGVRQGPASQCQTGFSDSPRKSPNRDSGSTRSQMDLIATIIGMASNAADRLQGFHHPNLLICVTEGQGVADDMIVAAQGCAVDANNRLCGLELVRNDRSRELVGCKALLLACNGFGGNPGMVRDLIPEMARALYFGHAGNQGNAIAWGRALGAELAHLSAYQGHGSVATPHNILITWAVIVEGGIQINTEGRRFCDESQGYSEQAAEILRQPGGIAWTVFDERAASIARQFEDFLAAERAGAILTAGTIEDLAALMRVPISVFVGEWTNVESLKAKGKRDLHGRIFSPAQACSRPYHAVKVTGALFHTQGGLAIDAVARVRRENGTVFSNLFAAGGAACGVSGTNAAGYLSGNGLLTATVLGRLAGVAAAALISAT